MLRTNGLILFLFLCDSHLLIQISLRNFFCSILNFYIGKNTLIDFIAYRNIKNLSNLYIFTVNFLVVNFSYSLYIIIFNNFFIDFTGPLDRIFDLTNNFISFHN
jgi:hypothetical protein